MTNPAEPEVAKPQYRSKESGPSKKWNDKKREIPHATKKKAKGGLAKAPVDEAQKRRNTILEEVRRKREIEEK